MIVKVVMVLDPDVIIRVQLNNALHAESVIALGLIFLLKEEMHLVILIQGCFELKTGFLIF